MSISATYLRRKEAAAYIKSKLGYGATAYLAKLATVGGGPEIVYASRFPLYSVDALDEWIAAQLSQPVQSTPQHDEKNTRALLHGGAL